MKSYLEFINEAATKDEKAKTTFLNQVNKRITDAHQLQRITKDVNMGYAQQLIMDISRGALLSKFSFNEEKFRDVYFKKFKSHIRDEDMQDTLNIISLLRTDAAWKKFASLKGFFG